MAATLEHYRYPFRALDSACDIQLFAPSRDDAAHASGLAMGEIARVDARYSLRGDSAVSAINRAAAAGKGIVVSDETAGLLDHAAKAFADSDGTFDITAAPLRRLWRFDSATAPEPDLLARTIEKVGWTKVRWQTPNLSFSVAGMEIDFGLLLRAYAVDRAAHALRAAGIEHGIVNVGGDVHAVGPRADREGWHVGVRRPVAEGMVSLTRLREGALATVGDYQRVLDIEGETFARLINPKTGWPVRGLAQATVTAPLCVTAATAAAIAMLKEGEGAAWLSKTRLAHVLIGTDGDASGSL
jgi:thiamine biosynthesis lipoprotein